MHQLLHRATLLIACLAGFALAGCQTPDLKPFAAATGAVTAGINRGGELAIAPLAAEPATTPAGELIAVNSPDHPAAKLAAEWQVRRQAADAILSYSASLAAISDAAANRKANATALYDSVKKLAEAVPGVSLGSSAVGNLVVSVAGVFVEVKAWHDMAGAVRGADPAIQLIASAFKQDLADMARLHEGYYIGKLTLAGGSDSRKLVRLETQLRQQQGARRAAIAANPADAEAATELLRIDNLLVGLERDLTAWRDDVAHNQAALAEGKRFYATAGATIEAWAAAHADLVKVFAEKRTPNLALLVARAQELNSEIEDLKNARKTAASP